MITKVSRSKIAKGKPKELFWTAWRNQDGRCLLTDKPLKKSKCVIGLFILDDEQKKNENGLTSVPYLLHENFLSQSKETTLLLVDEFFDGVFTKENPIETAKKDSTPTNNSI